MSQQPKKRGRKRKHLPMEGDKLQPMPSSVSGIEVASAKSRVPADIACHGEVKEKKTRVQNVKRIEAKGSKVDFYMESRATRERIHASLMKRRYSNYQMREEGLDQRYRNIYTKMKSGAFSSSDLACWTDVVSKGMVKNVCKIMEFLLQNGPMTKIETAIFDNCAELLKSYYSERISLVQRKTPDAHHYYNTTYYPEASTSVYSLFIDNKEISYKKAILKALEKNHQI